MEDINHVYQRLRENVEHTLGRKMLTPRDFDFLAMRVYDTTQTSLTAMTFKRFWGYLGEKNRHAPRLVTLNALAQLVGYTDWQAYYQYSSGNGEIESDFLKNKALPTNALGEGTLIQLMWHPNRKVIIKHNGYEVFTVVESVNSKLSVGDTFRCGLIVEGEPMYLAQLKHEGGAPVSYVCGQENGVKWRLMRTEEEKSNADKQLL